MKTKKIFFFCLLFVNVAFAFLPKTYLLDSETDSYTDTNVFRFRYDKAFATKNNLSEVNVEKLDPGLMGIETVVSKDRFLKPGLLEKLFPGKTFTTAEAEKLNAAILAFEVIFRHKKQYPVYYHPDCYVDLYLKSDIDFAYPEPGVEGDRLMAPTIVEKSLAPIKRALLAENKEARYNELLIQQTAALEAHYHDRAYLVKKSEIKNVKKYYPLLVANYHRGVFEGVDLVQVGPDKGCQAFSEMGSDGMVLLKKATAKNASLSLEDFYIFSIPSDIWPKY